MFSWFFSSKKAITGEDILRVLYYLRFTSNIEFAISVIEEGVKLVPDIHKRFLLEFANGEFLEATVLLVREMMKKWPEDLVEPMATLLRNKSIVAAMAMGCEKSKYNGTYYVPVRDALKMNSQDFRLALVELRKKWSVMSRNYPQSKEYTLVLQGEPLTFNITNPYPQYPIYTVYRGVTKKYDYMYDPVETNLSAPLTQKMLDDICRNIQSRPIVIITSNIGEVTLPKDVYIVFTEKTSIWGERIYPFFNEKGHSVLRNLLNFVESLNL